MHLLVPADGFFLRLAPSAGTQPNEIPVHDERPPNLFTFSLRTEHHQLPEVVPSDLEPTETSQIVPGDPEVDIHKPDEAVPSDL